MPERPLDTELGRFTVFRFDDSPAHQDTDIETATDIPSASEPYFEQRIEAGVGAAFLTRVLFRKHGPHPMSAVYIYAKPGHMLARHSHDVDCLYVILSGSALMGNQVLSPGDGFFVPGGHYYKYQAGDSGAEVLEFRSHAFFSTTFKDERPEVWRRMIELVNDRRPEWEGDVVPPLRR